MFKDLYLLWIVCLIIGYILGGGFIQTFKFFGKFALAGWYLIPIFPADLIFVLFTFVFGVGFLIDAPIVYIIFGYIQAKKNREAAENYLASLGTQGY